MSRRRILAALALAVPVFACTADGPVTAPARTGAHQDTGIKPRSTPAPLYSAPSEAEKGRPDHYIVKLKDALVPAHGIHRVTERVLALTTAGARKTWPTFRGFYARIPSAEVDAIRQHPLVEYVEEDRAFAATSMETTDTDVGSIAMPPRTQAPAPWHLDRIDQDHYPLNNTFSTDYSGDGVTIYVIDTGIRASHDQFGGRAVTKYQAEESWEPPFGDCGGHGTQVASAAAGSTVGVAKDASVVGVRVAGCGPLIWLGDILDGMEWVANNHAGPAVATISVWAHDLNPSRSARDAAEDLIDAGVVLVRAAGNDNENACNGDEMRSVRSVLVAGALAPWSDSRADFSNYGPCVDLYAPGDGLWLASKGGDSDSANVSGTSFAAPLLAGAAAMYLEQYPNDPPSVVHGVMKGGATPNKVPGSGVDRILYVNQPRITLVSWEGPTEVGVGEQCTWEAAVDGGRPPFTYTWSGILGGATRSISGSIAEGGELTLRVADSSGLSDAYTAFVSVGNSANCSN